MAPIRPVRLAAPLAIAAILLFAAGCGGKSGPDAIGPAPTATTGQPAPTGSGQPSKTGGPAPTTTKTTTSSTSDWPSPEDCISYNPSTLTIHYEAGFYAINN